MTDHGLTLALNKTEIVLLTRKHIPTIVPMMVDELAIMTKRAAKYLGVTLDTKLNYGAHLDRVCEKAATRIAQLSYLMANLRGPRRTVKRLLIATTNSILLYGAEVWAGAMEVQLQLQKYSYRNSMFLPNNIGRGSGIITRVIPVGVLVIERKRIYEGTWIRTTL